jgi:hypothetical protein
MRLPGETRNKIYALALGSHIFGRTRRRRDPLDQHFISHLLVCRQIYNEAHDFLFTYNTFIIQVRKNKASRRLSPLEYIFGALSKEQKRLIRSVRLETANFNL